MPDSRRDHYRVVYPIAERPALEIGWMSFEVLECSEKGLRYDVGERPRPPIGSEVVGRLAFRSGESMDVVGDVIRVQASHVALMLRAPGLPFGVVMQEQRYLRRKGYRVTG